MFNSSCFICRPDFNINTASVLPQCFNYGYYFALRSANTATARYINPEWDKGSSAVLESHQLPLGSPPKFPPGGFSVGYVMHYGSHGGGGMAGHQGGMRRHILAHSSPPGPQTNALQSDHTGTVLRPSTRTLTLRFREMKHSWSCSPPTALPY